VWPAEGRWLELGCGHAIVPPWASPSTTLPAVAPSRVIGLDADRAALARHPSIVLRVNASAETLPFADGTFTLVTANMVLEHLLQPAQVFAEVARVLRPGGRFLIHTPNRGGYTTRLTRLIPRGWRAPLAGWLHGRRPEDVYPAYYLANTPAVLRRLASDAALTVTDISYVQTTAQLTAIPPAAILELVLIRALERPALRRWRADLIAVFSKP
jgi:ubiquinone/menaquinone biosynthesis C-methylase UbiE